MRPAVPPLSAATTPPQRHRQWLLWVIVAGTVLLVLALGLPGLWPASSPAPADDAPLTAAEREQLQQRVAARQLVLRHRPDDADAWRAQGEDWVRLEALAPAAQAFRHALALRPGDPQLQTDLASTLAAQPGADLDGEVQTLLTQALAGAPQHPKALSLAGTLAFARGDAASAIHHWEQAQRQLPPHSLAAQQLRVGLAQARRQLAAPQGR